MIPRILALVALLIIAGTPAALVAQPVDSQMPGGQPSPGGQPDASSGASLWGAIAFTADGSYATAWKQPSKPEAEADVSKRCARMGRGACEVISFPGNLCGALANFRSGRYRAAYTGGGTTSPEAQKAAIDRCNGDRRAGGRCQLRTVVCGDGR